MLSASVVLRLAEEDERVVAGAAVGSLAVDGGDRFSDLDLTFGIADHVPVAEVLDDWTRTLVGELDAVHLADLERGPTTYRVFLLPDALQFDLSMTPAARFRPAGPRFRLLFGETAAGDRFQPTRGLFIPRRRSRTTSSGGASSTRSTRARASSAGVSGRPSTTSAPCATTHSRLPASARGCPRCRRAATTTFPPRPSLDSRMPTSARSSLGRSGQPLPHPFARSCARARRRVYRTRPPSSSGSPSFADEAAVSRRGERLPGFRSASSGKPGSGGLRQASHRTRPDHCRRYDMRFFARRLFLVGAVLAALALLMTPALAGADDDDDDGGGGGADRAFCAPAGPPRAAGSVPLRRACQTSTSTPAVVLMGQNPTGHWGDRKYLQSRPR